MILEFIGNAPKTKYISIGVNGNNLVDDLVFIIGRKQGKNDLYEFTPKIKITTSERDFAEYSGDDLTVEKIEERDTIKITYALPEIVTERGNVDMLIVFEKAIEGGEVKTWQTLPFNINFPDGIDESDSLIEAYPNIVRELKADTKKAVDDSAVAVSTANAAKNTADTAKSTADNAKKASSEAVATANAAKSTADSVTAAETNRVSAENARASAEAARVTAENLRSTAEGTRKTNEDARKASETARASAEAARVSAESVRTDSEESREFAESIRTTNESARKSAESARTSAESTRVSNENTRKTNETARGTAETARADAEGEREAAETARANAESARASAESTRKTNETARGTAETARASAEASRVSAESARVEAENERKVAVCRIWKIINDIIGEYSVGLEYRLSDNGKYYICTGIGTCTDKDVIIPDEHEGLPVEEIGINAFAEADIDSIALPRTMRVAFGGSLSSPSIKRVIVRSGKELWSYELFTGNSTCLYDGKEVWNNGKSAFCSVEVYKNEYPTAWEPYEWKLVPGYYDTNATLLEISLPWSEEDYYYEGWELLNATIFYDVSAPTPLDVRVSRLEIESETQKKDLDRLLGRSKPTKELVYELSADGTYATCIGLSFGTSKDKDIVIASEYEGVPVTHVEDSSTGNWEDTFRHTDITSVTMPDSVTYLGFAFLECSNLTKVTLSKNLTEMGSSCFNGCTNLTEIVIPDRVMSIGGDAFSGTSLKEIILPASIQYLDYYAFSGVPALTDIYVPWEEGAIEGAPWGAANAEVHYNSPKAKSINDRLLALENDMGDIDTALDELHAYAQSLTGGDS